MRMRALLLGTSLLASSVAFADPVRVPPIQVAAASATASATAGTAGGSQPQITGTVTAPAGMPPPIHQLSPSASLNAKEKVAAAKAAGWRNGFERPTRGQGGIVLWTFGQSQPSVVCAPLQACDVALQPGEIVQNLAAGDAVRWVITPAVSGSGDTRTTHLNIKPTDSGLTSSLMVYTDKRIYSIKLVSTQAQWTPLTGFVYPEAPQTAWENYRANMGTDTVLANGSGGSGEVGFGYHISGNAPWKPTQAYSQGGKTIVLLPEEIQYGAAPAVIGLANDGSWFSDPGEQMLRYRFVSGSKIIIDGLPEHFKLVTGVGRNQQKVDIRRGSR
jgi:P-type conjugative transfer protein TrbG